MSAPAVPPTNGVTEEKTTEKDVSSRRKTIVGLRPQPTLPGSTSSVLEAGITAPPVLADQQLAAFDGLVISDQPANILTSLNGSKSARSGDSAEDEQSHLSTSSTKQHSLETKSMASVTTFAMDEKESIRPDDSASVRAADDEEVGSNLSRNATFNQEPDVIMPSLRGVGRLSILTSIVPVRRFHTLTNPPRFGSLEDPLGEAVDDPDTIITNEVPVIENDQPPMVVPVSVTPDEKLLDALASPKDRLALLQLEERLIKFIAETSADFIDLPPQHAYARLLAHKLADYYNLQHVINDDGMSIRLLRTSSASRPTPLAALATSIPVGSSQTLGQKAVKIMRRAGLPRQFSTANSTAASSSVPSKATSEAGHSEEGIIISPTEASTPSRDRTKMTREEREAQYKAARERIFGNPDELSLGENNSTGENSTNMSRSSSSSGKRKTRKQKTPKDDTFDSRSAFVPSYGPMHVQHVPSYQPQHYMEQSYQPQYESSPSGYGAQLNYSSTPTQAYPGFEQTMQYNPNGDFSQNQNYGPGDGWASMQQPQNNFYNYPQNTSAFHQNMGQPINSMNPQIAQHQQSPALQQQQRSWSDQYQQQYPQTMHQQVPNNSWQGYHPYSQPQQFGPPPNHQSQPPFQANMQQAYPPQRQQVMSSPISSGHNRHGTLFNPQTKTFVPSNAPSRTGNRQNRKKNSPNSTNNQSRQNSVNKNQAPNSSFVAATQINRSQDQRGVSFSSSKAGLEVLQQKYGKHHANLPKKPPVAQIGGPPDSTNFLGQKAHGETLVVNGGAGVRKNE